MWRGCSLSKEIAVIGYGAWGRQHVRVLRALGALRYAYDSDNDVRAQMLRDGVSTCSLYAMWEDRGLKGVVIATPPATHKNLTLDALAASKAVLVEKPMALTVADAEEMARAAEAAKVPLMVGHTMRYHGGFIDLWDAVQVGYVGRLEYLYSHRLQPGRVRSDVSCLWSLAPHDASMLIAVAGMPVSLSCTQGVSRTGLADIITATLEFVDDVHGHFFVSWLHPAKQREFVVVGELRALVMEQDPPDEPLEIELSLFIEGIRTGEPMSTSTDAKAGINVVRVLEACERSMQQGGVRVCL